MPSVTARFSSADYYGGMTASLFSGESLGYLLVGLLAFALGTLYWSLHLLLRQETPQVFYVSDLAWLASFVFLLALTLTLPTAEERRFRTRLCRLVPVVCLPHFISCTSPTATCSRTFSCAA